jgi:hypothetical protein
VLHHASGEHLSLGTLYVPANKNDAQGYGSALTYARRYGLMTAFGVPAEDDDGNAAAASAPRSSGTAKITEDQVLILQGYASGGVIDAARFCSLYGIASFKELPADKWADALEKVKAKQSRKPEPVQ